MLGAGWSGFRTPEGKRYFLYSKTEQIGPEAHPDSYSRVSLCGLLTGGEAGRGRSLPLTSNYCQGEE
jgi:hypothetical protein